MASLCSNLKALMSLAKINASELARRTGVAQPIIHRLSTGQNTNPKLATVKPISEYFMVTVSQLIGEESLPSDKSFYRVSSEHRGWNRVPLITWQDAVAWPNALNQYQESENSVYVSTDANVSKLAYGLKIKGCAMEPIFPENTTVVVEPSRDPKDRDFVIVHLHNDPEARLKQVIMDGSDYYLKSLNPDLEEVRVTKMQPQDRFLGIMAQAKVDY